MYLHIILSDLNKTMVLVALVGVLLFQFYVKLNDQRVWVAQSKNIYVKNLRY